MMLPTSFTSPLLVCVTGKREERLYRRRRFSQTIDLVSLFVRLFVRSLRRRSK